MSKIAQKLGGIVVTLAIAGVMVSGCGRKGDLDRPSTPVEQQNIRKTGNEPKPQPTADQPFFLDPLL